MLYSSSPSTYGKPPYRSGKNNCGFVAPESLITSFDDLLDSEKSFLMCCGYLRS